MNAGIIIDNTYYSLMGTLHSSKRQIFSGLEVIEQKNVNISPLITAYEFENELVRVKLEFTTPLLLRELDVLSRPLSYIEYDVEIKDKNLRDIKFYFDISPECCVNEWTQEVVLKNSDFGVFCGNKEQKILGRAGDNVCIDWGYLHLIHKDAKFVFTDIELYNRGFVVRNADTEKTYNAFNEAPVMAVITSELNGLIAVAYDDIKAIEYFGERLDDFYKETDGSFDNMVKRAVSQYDDIKQKCVLFSEELQAEASKISREYEKIISLIYRQVIAAHKLVRDTDGNILFISKECFSNGCAATLDVSYPSMPMFLKYNPELVKGMLRPIIRVARSEEWADKEFSPHDAGRYPCLMGQAYEKESGGAQMPIEECGNMLIMTAALTKVSGNSDFAEENKDLLKQWAEYLTENGYDPQNQLCTDDFAGKWEHNCNLSVKAIVAIGAYGKLFNNSRFTDIAKQYADRWIEDTRTEIGTLLAFDRQDTWSIKYNMIWDRLLGLGLFPREVYQKEIEAYKMKMCKYGVPLDCRSNYAKLDWLAWTTVMIDDSQYTQTVYKKIYDYINETIDRAPVGDWYNVESGRQYAFQNRSVLGALFINIM